MTKFQKLKGVLTGLVQMLFAIVIILFPQEGYYLVFAVLTLSLAIYGLKELIFYFSMARFMVDGRMTLFKGVILLDLGIFAGSLYDIPRLYLLLYLVGVHAFAGFVEILRALEARKNKGHYKLKFTHGVFDVLIGIACFVYIKSPNTVTVIYAIGLFYSAILRIISSLRRTTLIYIP